MPLPRGTPLPSLPYPAGCRSTRGLSWAFIGVTGPAFVVGPVSPSIGLWIHQAGGDPEEGDLEGRNPGGGERGGP